MQVKGETTAKVLCKHMISLYLSSVSSLIEINNEEQLRRDIKKDLVIKASMEDIDILMVSIFGKCLLPILIVSYTLKHSKLKKNQEKKEEKDG